MSRLPIIGVAVLVILAAIGGWYYMHTRNAPAAPAPVAAQRLGPPLEPPIEHPIPQAPGADTAAAPLPALSDSDSAISGALADAAGDASPTRYLLTENLIRRIVVTIDNLARQKVPLEKRPVGAVPGVFLADGDELHATLDPANFARYQPMVAVIGGLDMQRLCTVYFKYYPLFQRAYDDLGYPNGYFNDRLVQVIDSLLATPQPSGPIGLVRPNVMYQFADAGLESRPAGQKLLLRMGPDNARVIKAKLAELRSLIVATPPPRR